MANSSDLPRHIAIIMDGNGRWAKSQNKLRISGHKHGRDTVRNIIEYAAELKISVISFFAFSRENWARPRAEVAMLMDLMQRGLIDETDNFVKENICVKIIGSRQNLSAKLIKSIEKIEDLTCHCKRMTVVFAIDYSGRWSIVETAKNLLKSVDNQMLDRQQIDEATFEAHRPMANLPEVDLLIRTSGEERISNYYLWELAYSELYFTETLWPDFSRNDFDKALQSYAKRERRFGKIVD